MTGTIMIKESMAKLNISRISNHLKDVLSFPYYLELGTIDFNVLIRLLNYELVNLDDVTYYPIQNSGLGKCDVSSPTLRKILPFLFYHNLFETNRSLQLFITYGLLRYRDEIGKEIFAPIVLIPVNLYFEEDKVFVQQISRPIENSVLLSNLSETKKINIVPAEKLDTVYAIDHYCMSFLKYEECYVELENYLTFTSTREQEISIDMDKFAVPKHFDEYLYDRLYDSDHRPIYYYQKLNRNQRYAVNSASKGNSLVITGRMGTGKTTALINIAMDAMSRGQKVLYVSNMKKTLDFVYRAFVEKDLNQYVCNFSDSFAGFLQNEVILHPKTPTSANASDGLYQNYQYISEYEYAISSRILDNRYLDIMNELAMLSDLPKQILSLDDLSGLYKHEYLDAVNALQTIVSLVEKMGSLKNTIWKEIPIINNIKYPNQIFTLLFQIQKCFTELQEEKTVLERDFGIREIPNYAYLKNLIHNIKNLNITDIPHAWLDPAIFEQAKEEFRDLKTEIYRIGELEYTLSSRYTQLENINIHTEISLLLEPFFQKEDTLKINAILENRELLTVDIDKVPPQADIFKKSVGKISQLMNWDFNLRNYVFDELLSLYEIITDVKISNRLINSVFSGQYETTLKTMEEIYAVYDGLAKEAAALSDEIKTESGAFVDDPEEIARFESGQALKRNHVRQIETFRQKQPDQYQDLLKKLSLLKECRQKIGDVAGQFMLLSGSQPEAAVLSGYRRFYEYYTGIADKFAQSKIEKFLDRVTDEKNRNTKTTKTYLSAFAHFYASYQEINRIYQEVSVFRFSEPKTEFTDRINELLRIGDYLKNLYVSNDRLHSAAKNPAQNYIPAEEYFEIEVAVNAITAAKQSLNTNEQYQNLYGFLFESCNTNINKVARLLQTYKIFSESFKDNTFKALCFEKDRYLELISHLNICEADSDQLNDLFKIYFRIFKESVSRYYYSDFASNLKYLEKLLNAKEELITYLGVTENIRILNQFRLEKLIEMIIQADEYQNLITDFRYTYLSCVRDQFIEKYPFLVSSHSLASALKTATDLEDEMMKTVDEEIIRNIRKNHGNRLNVYGIRNLDYNTYVRRTGGVKSLFLATTQIVNGFLDVADYDLVIIDDAHLLSVNHYYKAVRGSQVIIAGELQLQSAVANNLISRMSSSRNLVFNYRFLPTPMALLNLMPGLYGRIYQEYYDNFGAEVLTDKVLEYISMLLKENSRNIINVFVSSITKQRWIYEELSNILLEDGFSEAQIISIFRNNLNIANLESGYMLHSDYNILFLEDYYEIDVEYIAVNLIDIVLQCSRKLLIYDSNNYLNIKNASKFLKEIRRILTGRNVFSKAEKEGILGVLAKKLEESQLIVYSSGSFSLTVRKQSRLYGIILLWDVDNPSDRTLNLYREYVYYRELGYRVFLIWLSELVQSVKGVAQKITEEIDKNDD